MYPRLCFAKLPILIGVLCVLSSSRAGAEDIPVKFKLYDTNDTKSKADVEPRLKARVTYRDPATELSAFPVLINVTKLEDNFYQVMVEKDRLIEHLIIDPVSTRYSPADVTKLVTKAPVTIYPGVSNSEGNFGFSAYMAQMNTYKGMISDLLTALPGREAEVKAFFGDAYKVQLTNMARVADEGTRFVTRPGEDRENELAQARKLADEVLKLYGLRPDNPVLNQEPLIIYNCPMPPRYCLFGCRRR